MSSYSISIYELTFRVVLRYCAVLQHSDLDLVTVPSTAVLRSTAALRFRFDYHTQYCSIAQYRNTTLKVSSYLLFLYELTFRVMLQYCAILQYCTETQDIGANNQSDTCPLLLKTSHAPTPSRPPLVAHS